MDRAIKKSIAAGMFGLMLITGCHHTANKSEKTTTSAIPVTVSPLRMSRMFSYLELSATSAFLFKASVKAPVTGYIENVFISQGDAVDNNRLLFTIKTKEASAVVTDSLNSLKFNGVINVKTVVTGLISSIEHPKGDYVADGDQLCQIAVPGSFVFILDIPFELSGSLNLNTRCEIVLPDGRLMHGLIKSRFPALAASSQTERFIVKLTESVSLPENLIAKIRIVKESVDNAVSLPKSSILTDETMKSFWVMKLINDTTAVKVLVTTGINDKEYVQIKMPAFKDTDLFLSSGNYGLGDTANVRVINTLSHEQ
jgi:hypothetical protein